MASGDDRNFCWLINCHLFHAYPLSAVESNLLPYLELILRALSRPHLSQHSNLLDVLTTKTVINIFVNTYE